MKSIFRFALLALLLVAVALVSALTAMRFAIHGEEVAIPTLVGLTPSDAERAVAAQGLQIEIERQYYSAQIPEGRITSQLPLPGTKVRRGWQVRVAQSLGPQRVAIPDVAGQSERAAELNIRRRGLDVSSTAQVRMSGTPAGQVLAQNPPANASQVSAPKINLLVTAPADLQVYVMPSFVGQPLGSVSRTLQDSGFKLGNVIVTATPPNGASSSANPPNVGTFNSSGPSEGYPPSMSGGTGAPGSSSGNGPAQTSAPPQATPASTVISQTPASGQKVTAGATVSLEVR
jgi:beta-lactam-binding protein with PASTA domain